MPPRAICDREGGLILNSRTVLISGIGVAGPTLAWWLQRYGFLPTLVEQSPALRQGGYLIDFWGAGFDVAERMGLVPELRRCAYAIEELRIVDQDGSGIASIDVAQLRSAIGNRLITLQRSDLASRIYAHLDGHTETIFGDSITDIDDTGEGLHVRFERSPERDFDLVVGADGLHSKVRSLTFGPSQQFEKHLGYHVAVSTVTDYALRDDGCYVCYNTPGGKSHASHYATDARCSFSCLCHRRAARFRAKSRNARCSRNYMATQDGNARISWKPRAVRTTSISMT